MQRRAIKLVKLKEMSLKEASTQQERLAWCGFSR
jgi:hypothetical protein